MKGNGMAAGAIGEGTDHLLIREAYAGLTACDVLKCLWRSSRINLTKILEFILNI